MKELMRMKWEIIIILIGLLVMWNMVAIGQMQKIIVTAVTVAIATLLAFKASKKFGAPKIKWEVVSEDAKVCFRLGIFIAFLFAYAIISNSFAVRIG